MPSEESMIEDLRELEEELREQEEYRKANIIDLFIKYSTHCKINKSKIKEKIEELSEIKYKEEKCEKINNMYYKMIKQYDYEIAQFTIQVLQELYGG